MTRFIPALAQSALASTSDQDSTTGPPGIDSPASCSAVPVHDAGFVFEFARDDEFVRDRR